MKTIVLTAYVVLMAALSAWAFEENVDPNQTGSILISNNALAPTQVFLNDPSAMRTFIVNTSSNNVFIVGYSTSSQLSISTFSTVSTSLSTGTYFVAAGTSTFSNIATPNTYTTWSPDGMNDPYRGPLWAVSSGNGAVIQRFRAH